MPTLAFGTDNGMGLGMAVAFEISELFGAKFEVAKAHSGSGLLVKIVFAAFGE